MKLMLLALSGKQFFIISFKAFQLTIFWFRYDSTSGGEREIQRTMLELLNQLDGFDSRGDVKVIMATNRIETLDPALIRPGRIDRKIELPLPDMKTKRRVFGIHTSRMTLAEDIELEEFVSAKDDLSGADIKVRFKFYFSFCPQFLTSVFFRRFALKLDCLHCVNVV